MNRRKFLEGLIAAGLAATVDVDKLLWTPGEKTIFIPAMEVVDVMNMAISIKFIRTFDINQDKFVSRLYTMYGAFPIDIKYVGDYGK